MANANLHLPCRNDLSGHPLAPLITLFDRLPTDHTANLSSCLNELYGGDLSFPHPSIAAIYVVANFVTTLDGVVSYQMPGKSGGGEISGFNGQDRFIMALLRSVADAVVFGSGTLHGDPGHIRIPEFIFPQLRDEFRSFRRTVLQKPLYPLNVVVTGSGKIDLDEPTFHTPELSTIIITTDTGQDRLRHDHGDRLSVTKIRIVDSPGNKIAPSSVLQILREECGVQLLLLEGGPTLFGEFLAEGKIEELFLTLSPQVAGPGEAHLRPGLVAHTSFSPDTAAWFELLTLKMSGSHLYSRYKCRSGNIGQSSEKFR